MDLIKIQLIETAIAIGIMVIASRIFVRLIDRAGTRFSYQKARVKLVKKIVNSISFLVFLFIIFLIWGIAPSELVAYLASLLTVVGIAFLAQWSIVSNITSTLIIFFNHQVNIGDTIAILDKDYQIEGKISDIGIFFIIIKLESNEYVSLPSNVFMQKMVKKVNMAKTARQNKIKTK